MSAVDFFYNMSTDFTYFVPVCGFFGLLAMLCMRRYRWSNVGVALLLAFNFAVVAYGIRHTEFSPRYILSACLLFLVGCGAAFDALLLKHKFRWLRILEVCLAVGLFCGGFTYGVIKCGRFKRRDTAVFAELGRSLAEVSEADRPVLVFDVCHHFPRLFFYGKVHDESGFKVEWLNADFSGEHPDMEQYFLQNYNSLLLFFRADRDRARQEALIAKRFPRTRWEWKRSSGGYCLWFARNDSEYRGKPLSAPAPRGEVVLNIDFDRTEPYSPAAAAQWESIQRRHKITLSGIPDGEFFPGVTPNPGHGFGGEVTLTRCSGGGMEFKSASYGGFQTEVLYLVPGKYAVTVVYGGSRGGRVEIGTYKPGFWSTRKFFVLDDGMRRGEGVFEVKQDYRGTLFFAVYGTVKISNIRIVKLQ